MTDLEPSSSVMGDPPPAAIAVFGDRVDVAMQFARVLATDGVSRGLIGPRESARLWDRHLLNSALVADLLPEGARVVDVGSGAGLPGLALAIRRPDVRVDLVDSLSRRTDFLTDVVRSLGLEGQARVIRGRAEDPAVVTTVGSAQWVTARAVAPLGRLVGWCLPLLVAGGRLLALKGANAEVEIAQNREQVRRAGGTTPTIVVCSHPLVSEGTTVVVVVKQPPVQRPRMTRPKQSHAGGGR